jgi:phosphatidate cytidylyltransferase
LNHPEGPASEKAAPVRRRWSDVGPRVVSGIVLIALTVTALYVGSYLLAAVVGIAYAGAYREWETMLSRAPLTPQSMILIGLVALCGFLYLLLGVWGTLAALIAACVIAASMGGKELPWRLGGIVLFSLLIVSIMVLRGNGTAGIWASLFLAVVVWMTDSAAFFTGRQIGGEKLAPEISPSKTWSGALGGLALGTGAGLIVWHLATDSPFWIGLALALAVSIVGQLGDLGESAIKRRFRIKDSGDIIPGHGGLMDRMDSLTFGVFLVVLVGAAHAGFGSVAEGLLYW